MEHINHHPLAEFVHRTFGTNFGDLVLAGYNDGPTQKPRTYHITEEVAGITLEWGIEIAGNAAPCGEEPLVMAVLLKLLLKRPSLSYRLGFEISEMLTELGWGNSPVTQRRIDGVISNYVSLLIQ